MTKKEEDNTSKPADNTAPEEKEPNFPDLEPAQPKKEIKEKEPQDPEYAEWLKQEKDLTWKRYRDSSSEAIKTKKELEETQRSYQEWQQKLTQELQEVYQRDPETAAKLFGIQQAAVETPKGEQQQQPAMDADQVARQVQAQLELNRFKDRNANYIKDDKDWGAIQDIALGFLGKADSDGNAYTIQTALRDALLLRHKDLIGDRAISEHLTSQAKRASASESGDFPSGSSSTDELDQDYYDTAEQLGVRITPEAKQRILERRRKLQAH